MNDATNLADFFKKIHSQKNINTSHISMYTSLYLYWKANCYANPFQITRHAIMQYAKIHSKATYHKCMKELHDLGYIVYNPSYHPHCGSKVSLVSLANNQNES